MKKVNIKVRELKDGKIRTKARKNSFSRIELIGILSTLIHQLNEQG